MSANKCCWLVLASLLVVGCSSARPDNEATALDFFKRGNAAFQKEDYRHAIRMYQQAATLDPRSPTIQYNLGLAFYEAQSYTDAVGAYTRALKLDPSMAEAHRNLALAEDRLYNLDAAQTHFNIYQAMMRAREPKGDSSPGGTVQAAPPKPSRAPAEYAAPAAGTMGAPEPVSQLRRYGGENGTAKPSDSPAKSGGDNKWWTQGSSPQTR